jgi:hypothetical protein
MYKDYRNASPLMGLVFSPEIPTAKNDGFQRSRNSTYSHRDCIELLIVFSKVLSFL